MFPGWACVSVGPSVYKHREPHSVQTVSQSGEATASALPTPSSKTTYLVFREAALGARFLGHWVLRCLQRVRGSADGPGDQGLNDPPGERAAPSSAPFSSSPAPSQGSAEPAALSRSLWACKSPQPCIKVSELPRPSLLGPDLPPASPREASETGKAPEPEDTEESGELAGGAPIAHQVLTFPLGPPPPPPLGLASELTAQPPGPSAGPQHGCHGWNSASRSGQQSFLNQFHLRCSCLPPPLLTASASANQAAGSLFRAERSRGPPPSSGRQLSWHLFPAGLQTCGLSRECPRSRDRRSAKARRAGSLGAPLGSVPGSRSRTGRCTQGFLLWRLC